MGFLDRLFGPERRRNDVAIEIDIQAGVLQRCDVCRAVSDKGHDERLPAADAIAHELFDRNDPSVAVFQGDRNDLLARLRSVRRSIPYGCICESS